MKTFSLRAASVDNHTDLALPSLTPRRSCCTSHVACCHKALCRLVFAVTLLLAPGIAHADVSDDFNAKFNALKPPENSSVHSDYLFEQIALGSQYTIRLLNQLNTSADQSNAKLDTLMEKFDLLIEQNRKIIDLLEKQQTND